MAQLQYKNHYAGSGKGYVHKAFDEKGAAGALREGEKRGLALATVRNWISVWRQPAAASATKKVKSVAAKKTKTPAKKAAPAKKAPAKKSPVKKAVKKAAPAKKSVAKKSKAPAAKPAPATKPARAPRPRTAPATDASTETVTLNG